MGITIKRTVRVKVIVTEGYKAQRLAEIEAAMDKLDAVGKRLEFELGSVAKRGCEENSALMERLRAGQRKNQQARAALGAELEQAAALEVGSESDRGALESLVEVEVGDDLSKIGSCEIVVKDDKVVEVRDSLCPRTGLT